MEWPRPRLDQAVVLNSMLQSDAAFSRDDLELLLDQDGVVLEVGH